MPSKPIHTKIDDQIIKLTNLDKVLFPSQGIVKAELINYFISTSSLLLRHISDRPLTLIRWPDGVEGKKFYSKNKPKWTPKWISSQKLPDSSDDNDYVVAKNKASLAWLANLAALEIHPMQSKISKPNYPDHFIFDLDPLSANEFEKLKELSLSLKDYLVNLGYAPFIKTSGSKGLHIYVPILPNWTFEELMNSVKKMSQDFIKTKAPYCTLAVHKGKRKGKILLDIYRNYQGNTCVAPYSLRGKAGAPISTPIAWDKLDQLASSRQYNLKNIDAYIADNDPWKNFYENARPLHDRSNRTAIQSIDSSNTKLEEYNSKRDFSKTEEPIAEAAKVTQQRFVIQLHDATNLHYDLRLESDGVLLSWAIPKALPIKKDKARLAIRTEDHPVKYLDFEGKIPKDEYGGGEMWIVESGTFEWIEKKDKKLKFKLNGKKYSASYSLFQTKDNQWLCKAIELPDVSQYQDQPKPMLANARKSIPTKSENYFYEIKWDGIRVHIKINGPDLKIFSRSGRDITKHFPELVAARDEIDVEAAILDGEIVVLDKIGKPVFSNVISRMHTLGEQSILTASKSKKSTCYIFDCLIVDGHSLINTHQERRHALLNALIPSKKYFRKSERFDDGQALLDSVREAGLEGIMAKRKDSTYAAGQRSDAWLKIKIRNELVATVIGYTKGEGDRTDLIGALHLAIIHDTDNYEYLGKVGTGFDHEMLKAITTQVQKLEVIKKPITEEIEEAQRTTWIKPTYQCNIEYASKTNTGTLREPVWKGWISGTKLALL